MTSPQSIASILGTFAEAVDDVTDETFRLFSQNVPSNNLGILDDKADTLLVEAAGREYEIRQSSGLLISKRSGGTTGAVLWKVTPILCDWIVSPQCCLWGSGILNPHTIIVELGCGVAGLVGLALGRLISRYVLTDQDYVMKLLRQNVDSNRPQGRSAKRSKPTENQKRSDSKNADNLSLVTLDWEADDVQVLKQVLDPGEEIGVVLVCDCVYNDYLIQPLTQACIDICSLREDRQTIVMIAQQLRTDEIFQEWMENLSQAFKIWRIRDEHLPVNLQSSSGYVIHLAMLKAGNSP